jgi:predicted transcriptional regulator
MTDVKEMPPKRGEAHIVIDRLGGVCAVAKLFGIKHPSVSEWLSSGEIPKYRVLQLQVTRPEVLKGTRWRVKGRRAAGEIIP